MIVTWPAPAGGLSCTYTWWRVQQHTPRTFSKAHIDMSIWSISPQHLQANATTASVPLSLQQLARSFQAGGARLRAQTDACARSPSLVRVVVGWVCACIEQESRMNQRVGAGCMDDEAVTRQALQQTLLMILGISVSMVWLMTRVHGLMVV
jgi:hypothetical protein